MNMVSTQRLLACLAVTVIVAGCTSGNGETKADGREPGPTLAETSVTSTPSSATNDSEPSYPASIECTLFYRPTVSAADGDTRTVSVKRTSTLTGDEATETMGEFSFGLMYYGDVPEGETVVVSARHLRDRSGIAGQTTYSSEQATVTSPHGFTGLQRLEVEGSELQWWCSSK
jgi:hypothetical protein